MRPNSVTALAPAKVNLYLHVLGKRPDGYHELQSFVAFADAGDMVGAAPADAWSLSIGGPFAGRLSDEPLDGNLVLGAARRLMARTGGAAAMTLTKNLPVAAGIGGGSADAAAALRCLHRLLGADPGGPAEWADLGADIPVCLLDRPALVQGMGERLTPLPAMPPLPAVLVNPGVPSATGPVFRALAGRFGAPAAEPLPGPAALSDARNLAAWLLRMRNDLTGPAIETVPVVADVLRSLEALPGVLLARMSGSGATCFGLFADLATAQKAAVRLTSERPGWWVQPVTLRGWPED